jgi:hypothetical protein
LEGGEHLLATCVSKVIISIRHLHDFAELHGLPDISLHESDSTKEA